MTVVEDTWFGVEKKRDNLCDIQFTIYEQMDKYNDLHENQSKIIQKSNKGKLRKI